ncbi:MAG: hypothetical protein CMJ72_11200, partial [Planctomycetaceae bacterium]|nr:hypothetical protein [Planctomycetaceae bacterium]
SVDHQIEQLAAWTERNYPEGPQLQAFGSEGGQMASATTTIDTSIDDAIETAYTTDGTANGTAFVESEY